MRLASAFFASGSAFILSRSLASAFNLAPSPLQQSLARTVGVSFLSMSSSSSSSSSSNTATTYMEALSAAATASLGRPVTLEPTRGGGASGGGGATTTAVRDTATGMRYFCKAAGGADNPMLAAEYKGVKAMAETHTIRVPTPIAYGSFQSKSFCLFEYLEFTGGGDQYELGQQLARMHRHTAPKFGFEVDNTIGATPQPNLPWIDSWPEFWDVHRLGHMLKLTGNAGLPDAKVEKLRDKTKELLSHGPEPSLLHGDLWGGNKGFCKEGDATVPCIFDPATYYGDREADVGFTNDFYRGYESEWPLPEGHEERRTVYNLYHILNHEVLFGGGYLSQARGMMEKILRS